MAIRVPAGVRTQKVDRAVTHSAQPGSETGGALAPQCPSSAPASPALARQTLQSILQRARRLDAPAQNESAEASPAAANDVIQRKSTKVIDPTILKKQKSLIIKDSYDRIISLVKDYLDDANAPPTNYGRRLRYTELLLQRVADWETDNGPVDQAVRKSLFMSLADKRRLLLKQLKDSIALEVTQLQDDGLTQAKAAHKADRDKLTEYLNSAAASDERMLKNTAEWFQLGKAKLYAVTPTGDSDARIATAKMSVSRDEAWFPEGMDGSPGDILDTEVQYNERSLTDNTNVNLDTDGKTTGGWNVPGVVVITNPAKAAKEEVWETLRHEVQHDADFHEGRDANTGAHVAGQAFDLTGAHLKVNSTRTAYVATGKKGKKAAGDLAYKTYEAEVSLSRYKTEYRAYSFQEGESNGKYSKLDNTARDKPHDGKMFTERQLAIFKHIYEGYDYVKSNWDADTPLTGGRTFRDEVVNYWNPDTEAFNKFNSPRVDDFYRALDEIGAKETQTKPAKRNKRDFAPVAVGGQVEDVTDAGVVKLLAALDKLNGDDGDYIFNESAAMMKKIRAHLKGAALALVLDKLKDLADFSKLANISLFD